MCAKDLRRDEIIASPELRNNSMMDSTVAVEVYTVLFWCGGVGVGQRKRERTEEVRRRRRRRNYPCLS
jgi:hypothetical protein